MGTLMRQYMHANRCIDTKSISTSRRMRIRDGRMSHSSARMLPPHPSPGPRVSPLGPCQIPDQPIPTFKYSYTGTCRH